MKSLYFNLLKKLSLLATLIYFCLLRIINWSKKHTSPKIYSFFSHIIVWMRSFNTNDPEVEFYPAALEILETPPSPAGRAIAGLLILFFLITLIWACVGSVDIIATAQGKIVPTGRTKIIQPLEAGVVRSIHVQDGQKVKAGEILIEIDSTINESERERLHKELITTSLDVARFKTVLGYYQNPPIEFISPPEATPVQITTQKSLAENQIGELRAKLSGLKHQIAQNEGNRAAVEATIIKLRQSIPMLKERAQMREYLSKKEYGSKLETLAAQQDLVEHEEELKVQQGRLAEATGGVESLRQQQKQAEAEFQHINLDKLTEAEQKLASLQEQLIQAAQKFRLQTLKSPVDGTVQQLAIHTEGGVVTPAQTLLVIVPADTHIEIEAMVSNRDIGFVHVGQEAQVKIDTFNFTRYGLLRGKVTAISQDAIIHEKPQDKFGEAHPIGAENETSELQGQELIYTARISLEQSQMDIDGQWINLFPGMAITAEIKTGSRHIIEYLMSPLQRHTHQALREQ
jgi:hemolysin D